MLTFKSKPCIIIGVRQTKQKEIDDMMTTVAVKRIGTYSVEKEMEKFAREFLKEEFGVDLKIPIKINNRLTSTFGRFRGRTNMVTGVREPIVIEISKNIIEYHGFDFAYGTLKHELVHYALYIQNRPYNDGTYTFEQELKRVGAPSSGTRKGTRKKEVYQCKGCKHQFLRNRKLNNHNIYKGSNYNCSCGGELTYIGQEQPEKQIVLVNNNI